MATTESTTLAVPRRAHWRRSIGLITAVLLLSILLLPAIVCRTSFPQQIAQWLVPEVRIQFGHISLGWFSPLVVQQIQIDDLQGRALLQIESLATDRALLGLLLNYQQLGTVQVDRPHLHIVQRADGSNLEDLLHALLSSEEDTSTQLACVVEVKNGRCTVTSAHSASRSGDGVNDRWQARELHAVLELTDGARVSAKAKGRLHDLHHAATDPGAFQFELDMGNPAAAENFCIVQVERLPLEAMEASLNRLADPVRLRGELTGRCRYRWGGKGQGLQLRNVALNSLELSAPRWLHQDQLVLDQLQISGDVAQEQQHWHVDHLALRSDVGQLALSGVLPSQASFEDYFRQLEQHDVKVEGELDLARLTQSLPSTLRLREAAVVSSGRLALVLYSQRQEGYRQWNGRFEVTDLVGVHPGEQVALQQPIVMDLAVRQSPAGVAIERLNCQASFLQLSGKGTTEQGSATADGDLGLLAAEFGRFFKLDHFQLGGRFRSAMQWHRGSQQELIAQAQANFDNLIFNYADQALLEGPLALAAEATLSPQSLHLETARVHIDKLKAQFGEVKAGHLRGDFAVNRLKDSVELQWLADVTNLSYTSQPEGQPGPGRLVSTAAEKPAGRWRQELVRLKGQARYAPAQEVLQLDELHVSGDAVQLSARGSLAKLHDVRELDLQGQIEYDLARLAARFLPSDEQPLMINGRQRHGFVLHGPLNANAQQPSSSPSLPSWQQRLAYLQGEFSFGWDSAALYGLLIGPGQLKAKLRDGQLVAERLVVPVSNGRLSMAPRLDLLAEPPRLLVDSGASVQQLHLGPELCRNWLKFVAPLVASATAAEGTLSLDVAHASLPLAAPEDAQVQGMLRIHSARVGPGPLSQPLLAMAQQIKAIVQQRPLASSDFAVPWLVLPQQQVSFEVRDGQVYHQGLQLTTNELTIRSQGSVGFDQSLSLMVDVAIPNTWLAAAPVRAALQGQVLRIPVTGSLAEPKLDGRSLEQLSAQLLQGAASRMLEDQLQRGLDRLLPRPRQNEQPR